jgi:ABC-type cobalamin/Fe3+-siderophores transport system ATPase subunit
MSSSFPLIGLASEYQRLLTSLKKRQPLLILGPGGSGKSALISAVLKDLARPADVIAIRHSPNLHDLLTDLARSLIRTNHAAFRNGAKPSGDPERWLRQQTSVHLKGVLWKAFEGDPRVIILDGVTDASFPMYRFLQRLYFTKGMALLATARDPVALGELARLFWDPRNTVHLRALKNEEAKQIFELAVKCFNIGHLDIEEFRGRALDAAQGNPGQIIEMCRFASNPMYVSGTHIKFAPLRIDVLMKFL